MPAEPTVEFWFSIASTYTYLSVTRLSAVECERGCRFVWRPFLLRTIMTEQDNFPFCDKPIKAASMWRYIERRAGLHEHSVPRPRALPDPGGTSRQSGRHPWRSGGLVCGLRRRDIPALVYRISGAGQRTEPQRDPAGDRARSGPRHRRSPIRAYRRCARCGDRSSATSIFLVLPISS